MGELKINEDSLKPNSHKYREEQIEKASEERDRLPPIVKKDGVVSTKKPLGQKFVETFISDDTNSIKNYILMDVVIPGIKNAVLDVMEMAFFGTVSGKKRGRSERRDDRTDYRSSYYGNSSSRSRRDRKERAHRDEKVDYRNIILSNREDAEEVIEQLHKRIKKHGAASIADLFDLIDEPSNYNDNNWGWTNPRDIGLRRVARGFLIDVTEPEWLD